MKVKGGSTSTDVARKYIGLAEVKVIAINPTRDELEVIYGKAMEREPNYVFDKDGKRTVLINPYLQTVNPVDGKKVIFSCFKIWISNDIVLFTIDGVEKCRVIDSYGECATVTKEEFKSGKVPGTSRVLGNFKPAHRGEETLLSFIKTWIQVQESTTWDKDARRWVPVDKAFLDDAKIEYNWDQWTSGDVSDLKQMVLQYKDCSLKMCFGVMLEKDNTFYQTVYDGMFLRNWNKKTDYLKSRIDSWLEKDAKIYNKETGTYTTAKRKDIYQFSVDYIKIWEQSVFDFAKQQNGEPPAIGEKKKESSAWDNFVSQQATTPSAAGTVNDLPPIPNSESAPEYNPEEDNDFPF